MSANDLPAVVTAAGDGTRFRPFSAVVPKEMLPLGPVPAVEHVITECLAGGASHVIVVTRPGDQIIPAHVGVLRRTGLPVEALPEDRSYGYGNATPLLTLSGRLAGCDAFAVAFGDDILLGEPRPGWNLAAMRNQMQPGTAAVIAGQLIDRSEARSFGIITTRPGQPDQAAAITQRPDPADVTEPLAVVSRLILRPSILRRLAPAGQASGEIDLGVAVGVLAAADPVRVHRIAGRWVTVGDPRQYLRALTAYWQYQPS
jgi:UTP--glucose-1-phosphate uridylyltransferase